MQTHTKDDATRNTNSDVWMFRDKTFGNNLAVGYEVEAEDGSIGKIDACSNEVGRSHIVVDTGSWIFGKKVLLPANVIERVDTKEEKVFVGRTKDEIKNAPEFEPDKLRDETYRNRFSTYYTGPRTQRV